MTCSPAAPAGWPRSQAAESRKLPITAAAQQRDHPAQADAISHTRRPVCPRQGESRDLVLGRSQHQVG